MEEVTQIAPQHQPIRWTIDAPAPAAESKAFWKNLRHFYRTGEKPASKHEMKLSSALSHLLPEKEAAYPFALPGEKASLSIALDEHTPFYFLDHLMDANQKENRTAFKAKLSTLIEGIHRLLGLKVQQTEAEQLKQTYDFAAELFAFDKMAKMMPKGAVDEISPERLSRLKKVIEALQKGLDHFKEQNGLLIIDKTAANTFKSKELFITAGIAIRESDAFDQTQRLFREQMSSFASLIKAYRIAGLEVEGAYQEDVHNEYFDHFSWHRLLPEELSLFQPIVLIVNQDYVFDDLSSFSKLLASNQPVKVIVVNHELISRPRPQLGWEDASHQFRQELAALCIAHRNVYTMQSSLDDPNFLLSGLRGLLQATYPALCHLSIPKEKGSNSMDNDLLTRAENAGRYFPRMIYDPRTVQDWGGRLDISANNQPKQKWPIYNLKVNTSADAAATIAVAFTYADYKAMYAEKVRELMLIPSAYYTEHLVPLGDYLGLPEEQLYGKVPYVLLIDENDQLFRAAVPNVWVVSCQERLDYWTFLQEIGGMSQTAAPAAASVKIAPKTTKGEEGMEAKLKADYDAKLAQVQEGAVAQAAERIIAALLNDEELSPQSAGK